MALSAAEKQKFAQQEQEITDLRRQLDVATTGTARITEESKAREAQLTQERDTALQNATDQEEHAADLKLQLDQAVAERDEAREYLAAEITSGAQLRALCDSQQADILELNEELTKAAGRSLNTESKPLNALRASNGQDYVLTVAKFHFDGQDYTEQTLGVDVLDQLVAREAGIIRLAE